MSQTKAQLIDPVDGSLVNADINASAAIAGTKISPDFGSQAISTTNDSVTIGDSIIHSGDTDTKIRFPSANTVSVEAGGSERFRINTTGVGIGTNNPDFEFVVEDSSGAAVIRAKDGANNKIVDLIANSTGGLIRTIGSYPLVLNTAQTERARIDSSGNFRISCTAQPSTTVAGYQFDAGGGTLRVSSGAGASGTTSGSISIVGANHNSNIENGANSGAGLNLFNANTNDGNSSSVSFHNKDSLSASRILGLNVSHTNRTGALVFMTSNGSHPVEKMRIDSSGNVGINQVPTRELSLHSPNNNNALIHFTNDDTGETSADGILVGLDGNENMVINNQETGKTINFTNGGSERLRIDSSGRLLIGTTTSVGTNTPNLQVKAASPASGFDNHIYLEGSETNGNANTGATIGFGGHDGSTARNWAQIAGFKTNGSSGNTSSFLSFRTRRSGVSGINEMWKITAMGSLLARDNKESAIGREFTNGNVPAGQTRDHTDNGRLNFNSIGGNGGGHITCLSVSSQDQNPSGALIIAGIHGQGFNTYDTILSQFDSGISVTFSGGTVSIQNTSSETIYYSVNVIHMGTGNTTYLGR